MDVLGDALLSLRIDASSIGIGRFCEPWGFFMLRSPPDRVFAHSMVKASCWLLNDKTGPIKLESGDCVLVLHGAPYSLVSGTKSPRLDFMEFWQQQLGLDRLASHTKRTAPIQFQIGGKGMQSRIISFAYLLRNPQHSPLLAALPEIIVIRANAGRIFPWLSGALKFLAAEETGNRPGYVATATHLAELAFISLLRAYALSDTGKSANWLRGINDSRIGKALAAIHAHPEQSWTTTALANIAGTSRATFARQFTALVGQTPIGYLISWRMRLAAELLRTETLSISSIAEKIGYRSERAFREAFKQNFDLAPTHYAKTYNERHR